MTKPTKPQLEVLRKMRDGWELGESMDMNGRSRLQQGGLGKGGETITISHPTVWALWTRKFIEVPLGGNSFPTRRFVLTAKGREAADE